MFVQGFQDGGSAPLDVISVASLLDPLITTRGDGFVDVKTTDGSATVYGYGDPDAALMFSRPDGEGIWDVIFETAKASGGVIMAGDAGWFGADTSIVADLPEGMEDLFSVVTSGAELLHVIRRS